MLNTNLSTYCLSCISLGDDCTFKLQYNLVLCYNMSEIVWCVKLPSVKVYMYIGL